MFQSVKVSQLKRCENIHFEHETSKVETNFRTFKRIEIQQKNSNFLVATSQLSMKLRENRKNSRTFSKRRNFLFRERKIGCRLQKKRKRNNFAIGRQPKTTGFYKTRKENRKRGKLSYYRPDLRSPSVLNLKTRKENRLNKFAFHCVCFCFNSRCFH